jgi:hypothetical protein
MTKVAAFGEADLSAGKPPAIRATRGILVRAGAQRGIKDMMRLPETAKRSQRAKAAVFLVIVLNAVFAFNNPVAAKRASSVASMTSLGVHSSLFCTTGGRILVVHECIGSGDNNYCSFGQTYISGGPGTFRLAEGNADIPKGCYSIHGFANTRVVGRATAVSTVWYDQ